MARGPSEACHPGQGEAHRTFPNVAHHVYLGGQSAPGAPKSLIPVPPLPPAASLRQAQEVDPDYGRIDHHADVVLALQP